VEADMTLRRPRFPVGTNQSAHGLWQGAGAVAVGALAAFAVVLFADLASPRGTTAGTVAKPKIPATAVVVKSVRYKLETRCGVDEARVGDRYFEAVHPLSDRSGKPPSGWAEPYQAGTMTLVSPVEAVFTDHAGHRVVFRLRPGARAFRHTCVVRRPSAPPRR
jgi:hypothetical protein